MVTTAELTQLARGEWDRAIASIAARQHGVITHAQLLAIGISSSGVRARVAAGRFHPLHRGVYAVGYPPLRAHGHWAAAVLACGSKAVLSHASAAALWGIRPSSASLIDVTATGRRGRGRDGIRVHGADALRACERTVVEGVPCTTVARTILDLAGFLAGGPLEYAIHRAQTQRVFNREDVIAALEHSPTRRGTAAVRRILGISGSDEDEVKSPLERRFLRLCRSAKLPAPRVNAWIALADGGGVEVDFSWPERRLVVEADSRAHHDTDRAFENDPRRDRLLTLAGWRVVRFTHRDLTEHPAAVLSELRRLLIG